MYYVEVRKWLNHAVFGLFSCLKKSQNKKIFLADFDLLHGIGLVERYFRAVFREFFSPKAALFSFFLKKLC